MRVLWVIKGLGAGGAERLLVWAAQTHDRRWVSIDVAYVVGRKDALVEELRDAGVEVRWLGDAEAGSAAWPRRLRGLVRSGDYDIVHVHSPLVAAVVRLFCLPWGRARRPVLVYTEHNVWSSYRRATRWLNALSFVRDDAHIAVSRAVRDSIWAPLRRGVRVIVHGIPLDAARANAVHRDDVRAELGVGPEQVLVGTVANLRREKGYPELLEAARMVLDGDRPVTFLAMGQGPMEDEISRMHADYGLGEGMRLLGYRPDVLRVLSACDLFALASLHEGYPVAVMEALALGLPIVSTAVGGVPEAVRDGIEGRLVAPGDARALAEALGAVIADGSVRREMAAAAAARARQYDIRRAVGEVEAIYRSLLPEGARA